MINADEDGGRNLKNAKRGNGIRYIRIGGRSSNTAAPWCNEAFHCRYVRNSTARVPLFCYARNSATHCGERMGTSSR